MANKMLLTSAFLHDILSPVLGIKTILKQMIEGGYGHSLEEIKPVLEAILQTTNKVSNLIENQKNNKNNLSINPRTIKYLNIFEVLQKLHIEYSPLAKSRSLSLHLEAYLPLAHGAGVMADVVCLERMLSNVIQNAIKYTEVGGVFIRLLNEKDDLVIEVEDTGKGIDSDELSNIFFPFYRAQTKSEGSGLGLYVAMMVAKSHNLTLLVDSK
ncbi:sensor histidine kinase, partial [Anabaena sp. CA = ATCC 33047]|uniref:sensor histidine kinase n=1 Tax=Anabaena sp. (strain CA / ATCC 33047) TaxID=52271 RepID=UPI0008337868